MLLVLVTACCAFLMLTNSSSRTLVWESFYNFLLPMSPSIHVVCLTPFLGLGLIQNLMIIRWPGWRDSPYCEVQKRESMEYCTQTIFYRPTWGRKFNAYFLFRSYYCIIFLFFSLYYVITYKDFWPTQYELSASFTLFCAMKWLMQSVKIFLKQFKRVFFFFLWIL